MSSAAEPCRTCDGTGYVETAAQDSRVIHYEPCRDCSGPATHRGGEGTMDTTLFDAVDSAAQQLAVVVNSLERLGDAALYRSALEAHAYTSMLRAELRARVQAARDAEQARARPEPSPREPS